MVAPLFASLLLALTHFYSYTLSHRRRVEKKELLFAPLKQPGSLSLGSAQPIPPGSLTPLGE